MVHWLIRHASNAGDMDMIPGQGTKMSHAAWCSQEKKKKNVKKKRRTRIVSTCYEDQSFILYYTSLFI